MTSAVRTPAFAGRFYPGQPDQLLRDIRQYMTSSVADGELIDAIGCVAPHAGYVYSGGVAGAVYRRLRVPNHCIVLCPNHTGRGVPLSIMSQTAWETPLGEVAADVMLGQRLLQQFSGLQEDSAAQRSEHAIEVQLPFLQHRNPRLKIVPIVVGTRDFDQLSGLGEAMAAVIAGFTRETGERVLIVASSDMNHYESDAVTRAKDRRAIGQVLAINARGLWDVVVREDVSMCGFGPATIMLTAAKLLGATSARLMRYATSGEVSGDYEEVVGYAGIVVT